MARASGEVTRAAGPPARAVAAGARPGDEPNAHERILDACRAEIAAHGVRGMRVQRVARTAGVSLGLVYYHFTDRIGLLDATVEAINAGADSRGRVAAGRRGGAEALERMLLAEFDEDRATRDGSVVWNEIRAAAVFEPEMGRALARSTERWEQGLLDALGGAGVPAADRPRCATLLTALVEGLSGRWLSGQITAARARDVIRSGLHAIVGAPAHADEANGG